MRRMLTLVMALAGGAGMADGAALERWPAPGGAPWSGAVKAGRFVHVAGIAPVGADGAVTGDVKAQTRVVLDRLAETLKAAGTSLARAAVVHVYLRDAADFAAMNEVYRTYWAQDPPTRTTVVAGLAHAGALVEMSAIALTPEAPREVIHPKGWAKALNPYSYGIKSGDTLFLSGLVSRSGRDNSPVPGDITVQTTTVLANAREILGAAGMTLADVVSAKVYISDGANFQAMNAAYRSHFPKDPPARATVITGLMSPANVVEITLVAVAGGSREVMAAVGPDGSARPANPNLSAAIRVADRVFLSGMLGNNDTNKGDMAAQTKETLAALGRSLKAAGVGWSDVTDTLVYVTDMARAQEIEAAWREVFGKDAPTRTVVRTGLVAPDGLVEIMLTAVR